MQVPHKTLANMVKYQVGAAQAMAKSVGGEVRHLKLHGALSNMACKDYDMARACYEGALEVAQKIAASRNKSPPVNAAVVVS